MIIVCLLGCRWIADLGSNRVMSSVGIKIGWDHQGPCTRLQGCTLTTRRDKRSPRKSSEQQLLQSTREDDPTVAAWVYCGSFRPSISKENIDSIGRCYRHCCLILVLDSSMGRVPSHAPIILSHINIPHKGIYLCPQSIPSKYLCTEFPTISPGIPICICILSHSHICPLSAITITSVLLTTVQT